MNVKALVAAVCGLLVGGVVHAEVKCNPMFSDHMVLQRELAIPVWGTADAGEKVTVKLQDKQASVTAGQDGKWIVRLPELKAGNPYELTVTGTNTITLQDVLIGDVWVCSGQSNMQFGLKGAINSDKEIAEADYPQIRLFTVPNIPSFTPRERLSTQNMPVWNVCSPKTAPGFSAVGYFFGRKLNKDLNVPIGLINSSWGGTIAEAWTPEPALLAKPELAPLVQTAKDYPARYPAIKAKYDADYAKWQAATKPTAADVKPSTQPAPRMPAAPDRNPNLAAVLYNGMINPVVPYGIKGAIWYQGESNVGRHVQYVTLMSTLITSWRQAWGEGDFPFLIVQLTSFMKDDPRSIGSSSWALQREAQVKIASSVPNTGVACIIDIGNTDDIHPKNKQDVGKRLGLIAEKMTYGKDVVAYGPTFKDMKVDGNKATITFDTFGDGMVNKGDTVGGFVVAGADGKFYPAAATLEGDRVTVSAAEVAEPKAVRYGWANSPNCTLFNKSGLPAIPFRTDTDKPQ
jgi:sialate O-acetylesterase